MASSTGPAHLAPTPAPPLGTSGMRTGTLTNLTPGAAIPFGGDKVVYVSPELAEAFRPGDRLIVLSATGDLLHIPGRVWEATTSAVGRAAEAFHAMGGVTDDHISRFFTLFADALADDDVFAPIAEANAADVAAARARGRSTTRLALGSKMRADMIDGLRMWAQAPSGRDEVTHRVEHPGWSVELVRSGLGVVGFVFEGRPNVFADACGVLRSGNTVVFRIGSDALGTARAIVTHALDPALAAAGLPPGAASLVPAAERSAGWAMFSDPRLSLAVARGSGTAVAQLGSAARQAGIPTSLHGTGGAWIVAGTHADPRSLRQAVRWSLDRKVCNTLNTCCIPRSRSAELVPAVLAGLEEAAAARGTEPKLHVVDGRSPDLPPAWSEVVEISRPAGPNPEPRAETQPEVEMGTEWEWEDSPEITLALVDDLDDAVGLFNRHSPLFVASVISDDADEQDRFWSSVDAPFVGNGYTRWVDGQFALGTPELGLSNWQGGRLFGRGGVLSGDSVFTLRTRSVQQDPGLHR